MRAVWIAGCAVLRSTVVRTVGGVLACMVGNGIGLSANENVPAANAGRVPVTRWAARFGRPGRDRAHRVGTSVIEGGTRCHVTGTTCRTQSMQVAQNRVVGVLPANDQKHSTEAAECSYEHVNVVRRLNQQGRSPGSAGEAVEV